MLEFTVDISKRNRSVPIYFVGNYNHKATTKTFTDYLVWERGDMWNQRFFVNTFIFITTQKKSRKLRAWKFFKEIDIFIMKIKVVKWFSA